MLQYFTLFFKKRTRNVLTRKSAGGFAKIFFYRQNPPHPATVLWHCPDFKNNKSYFYPHPKTTLPTPRFFSRKFYTKNRVKDITFNYKINNYCRHNQQGYLGSHAQQRRYLFYIYKRYYQFPLSSLLSTPHAPPAVLKQSLYKREIL